MNPFPFPARRRGPWHRAVLALKAALALSLPAALPHPGAAQPAVESYAEREDVQQFAAELAQRHGWREAWVQRTLRQARYQPAVARLIMPAPTPSAKNWGAYRSRMVEPVRLKAGLAFWRTHERWLTLAEERYGVPPEIVLGILGVETIYGQQMGSFRVIDALATLGFDFPAGRSDRSAFFRGELEQLLVLARREKADPASFKGSYAGAIGMPQFMPSSINQYAVDFDGNGHIDLAHSPADVIGSVAHYLAEYGWERGWPAFYEVAPPAQPEHLAALLGPDIVPLFSPQEFVDHGAQLPPTALQHPGKLALVQLLNGEEGAPSFVAGTSNFYVLTRYNWSSYYAMAVIALGQALREARGTPGTTALTASTATAGQATATTQVEVSH